MNSYTINHELSYALLAVPQDQSDEVSGFSPLIHEPTRETIEQAARAHGLLQDEEPPVCNTTDCNGNPEYCAQCMDQVDSDKLRGKLAESKRKYKDLHTQAKQLANDYQLAKNDNQRLALSVEELTTKLHNAETLVTGTNNQIEQLRRTTEAYKATLVAKDKEIEKLRRLLKGLNHSCLQNYLLSAMR
jgi:DNA repair exonuclease SbcCD ATPase subunit